MPPTYHAVLIGNREFPNEPGLPLLRCPLNDVRDMAELLKTEQHGPYQVTVLEDQAHHVIHRSIYSALKNAGREDRVLIYYAGHGKLSDDDGSLYLASHNTQLDYLPATSVAAADVMKFMNSSASKQLIFILDCCYSGAVDKLLSGAVFRGELADGVAGNLRGAGGRGSYILTASTSLQRAEEREGDKNGLLTKHLIAGIRDGRADRDDDGLISMHELTQYVQDQVRSEGRQTPLCYTLREEDGGIIIARTGKAARSRKLAELLDEIYAAAVARRASLRTVRSALTLLVPEPTASAEDKALSNQFVDQLHSARLDPHRFIEVLEDAPALASRLATASSALQRYLEQQRDEARHQLQSVTEQFEILRADDAATSKLLQGAMADLAAMTQCISDLRGQLNALEKTRKEEQALYQSAESKLQSDLADEKKLLASERSRTKDQETELRSLRRHIAEANEAIEKLTHQLAKEKGNANETTAQESGVKAFFDKLPKGALKNLDAGPPPPLPDPHLPDPSSKRRLPDSDFWKMLTRPSRREALLALFQQYSSEPDFFISPNIPADKLAKISSGFDLGGREVLALAASSRLFTSFLSACILFDTDTLHWSTFGLNSSMRYADIDPDTPKRERNSISVNNKVILSIYDLRMSTDALTSLIKAVATLNP